MDSSIFWGTAWRPNSQYARFPFFHLQTSNVNFWLKPLGLYNFVTGVLGGAYKILKGTYIRGGVISGLKKRFKTSYKAVLIKILFELTHFFKLHQNIVKIRIHFNTSLREAFVQGFVTWCIFCLQVDRLRAVSYFSLQSYCTRNLSTPHPHCNNNVVVCNRAGWEKRRTGRSLIVKLYGKWSEGNWKLLQVNGGFELPGVD